VTIESAPPCHAQSADAPFRDLGSRLFALGLRPASSVPLALVAGACIPLTVVTGGPSLCPFKVITGLPCPGCGLTRSVVALLHGELMTSVYFHPLGTPLVLFLVVLALIDAWGWRQSSRPGRARLPASWLPERVMRTPAPWIAIGALAVVWLVRLPLYVLGAWTF
jgi:hypothetical protein